MLTEFFKLGLVFSMYLSITRSFKLGTLNKLRFQKKKKSHQHILKSKYKKVQKKCKEQIFELKKRGDSGIARGPSASIARIMQKKKIIKGDHLFSVSGDE